MHRNADTAQSRLSKICEQLTDEVLVKARSDASEILALAREQAAKLIADAENKAIEREEIAKRRAAETEEMGRSALRLAAEKAVAALEEQIVSQIMNEGFYPKVEKAFETTELVKELLNGMVRAFEKGGLGSRAEIVVREGVDLKQMATSLVSDALEKGEGLTLSVAPHQKGVVLRLKDQALRIEISPESVKDLLGRYLQDELRELLFKEG